MVLRYLWPSCLVKPDTVIRVWYAINNPNIITTTFLNGAASDKNESDATS